MLSGKKKGDLEPVQFAPKGGFDFSMTFRDAEGQLKQMVFKNSKADPAPKEPPEHCKTKMDGPRWYSWNDQQCAKVFWCARDGTVAWGTQFHTGSSSKVTVDATDRLTWSHNCVNCHTDHKFSTPVVRGAKMDYNHCAAVLQKWGTVIQVKDQKKREVTVYKCHNCFYMVGQIFNA